jgi:hypothetical protein
MRDMCTRRRRCSNKRGKPALTVVADDAVE